jgi:hypothetical protein
LTCRACWPARCAPCCWGTGGLTSSRWRAAKRCISLQSRLRTQVEVPGTGDDTRLWGPPFVTSASGAKESAYFLSVNRNKRCALAIAASRTFSAFAAWYVIGCLRSIAVNMKAAAGQRLVQHLACAADVVVENFLPGATSRMNISYEHVRALNPKAVYVSISGYGASGPLAQHPVTA